MALISRHVPCSYCYGRLSSWAMRGLLLVCVVLGHTPLFKAVSGLLLYKCTPSRPAVVNVDWWCLNWVNSARWCCPIQDGTVAQHMGVALSCGHIFKVCWSLGPVPCSYCYGRLSSWAMWGLLLVCVVLGHTPLFKAVSSLLLYKCTPSRPAVVNVHWWCLNWVNSARWCCPIQDGTVAQHMGVALSSGQIHHAQFLLQGWLWAAGNILSLLDLRRDSNHVTGEPCSRAAVDASGTACSSCLLASALFRQATNLHAMLKAAVKPPCWGHFGVWKSDPRLWTRSLAQHRPVSWHSWCWAGSFPSKDQQSQRFNPSISFMGNVWKS